MIRKACPGCPNSLDTLLVKNRRITITRLGENKVVVDVVSDEDPNAKIHVEDTSVENCLYRIR